MTKPATRRERVRAETLDQITEAARDQLRDVGAAHLSLRGVAAALGMSPAGLYRYFDSREALLTTLVAEGYDALADAVAAGRDAAAGDDPADRMLAAARAFRAWSLAHPHEFGLLYGTPLPGYAAPEDGPTDVATRRVGAALLPPLAEAWRAGRLRTAPTEPGAALDVWAGEIGGLPPDAAATVLGAWTRLHGLVALEVFGHLRFLGPEAGDLADAELRALVDALIAPVGARR